MSHPLSALRPAAHAALIAAGLAIAAAPARATPDLTIPIGTCPSANLVTLQYGLRLTNGAVQKAGRNPPSGHRYLCEVVNDFASPTGNPTWNRIEFQFIDRNTTGSNHMTVRLMRRAIGSTRVVEVARVTSTLTAGALKTSGASVDGTKWDFTKNSNFVIVDVNTSFAPVDAVSVRLVTR